MANKLKAITTAAKKLYRSGKYPKWTDAIKAASKKISGKKPVGSVKASAAVKKVAIANKVRLPHGYETAKRKKHVVSGTIAGHKASLKSLYENEYARTLIKRDLHATTKREKKQLNVRLRQLKKQLKNL